MQRYGKKLFSSEVPLYRGILPKSDEESLPIYLQLVLIDGNFLQNLLKNTSF